MESPTVHVLLADDDEMDRFLFIEVFDELKIKTVVNTVNNGIQLLDYLNKDGAYLPQLIFLDLNMPRKNGMECLKEIRSNKKFSEISIAIYSTSKADKDIEEAFHSGANIYIIKPNDYDALKKVLNKAVTTIVLYKDFSFDRANFVLKL